MAGGAYIGWDELDEPEPLATPELLAERNERLATLMSERARLERELNRLLGKAPASDEDKREDARFPMLIHTPESRMEDRKLQDEQLRARLAAKRSLERARLSQLDEEARAERKREQERAAILQGLLEGAQDARRRELSELLEQRRRLEEAIQLRWVEQRRAALRAREAARRAEWQLFDDKSGRSRELASTVADARKRDQLVVQARLDRRATRARSTRTAEAKRDG